MARSRDNHRHDARRVAVIGLGRFGSSVARTLHELGYEVTALDVDERKVAEATRYATLAAQADGTSEEVLRSLEIDRSDVAVVGQGKNLEASVLITLQLKRLRVPWVIAKAESDLHGEVLARIGADRIVYPERDAGVRTAHSLTIFHLTDYIPLSPTSGVAKLSVPPHFAGRRLGDLLANGRDLSALLIKRGSTLIASPTPAEPLQSGDELVLAGPDAEIDEFAEGDG